MRLERIVIAKGYFPLDSSAVTDSIRNSDRAYPWGGSEEPRREYARDRKRKVARVGLRLAAATHNVHGLPRCFRVEITRLREKLGPRIVRAFERSKLSAYYLRWNVRDTFVDNRIARPHPPASFEAV